MCEYIRYLLDYIKRRYDKRIIALLRPFYIDVLFIQNCLCSLKYILIILILFSESICIFLSGFLGLQFLFQQNIHLVLLKFSSFCATEVILFLIEISMVSLTKKILLYQTVSARSFSSCWNFGNMFRNVECSEFPLIRYR